MAIPTGLWNQYNPYTQGLLGVPQGYWIGNRFVLPPSPPPPPSPSPSPTPTPTPSPTPPPSVGRGLERLLSMGSGAQGETGGFGGPVAPAQGLPGANVAPAGIPTGKTPASPSNAPGLPGMAPPSPPEVKTDLISEMKEFMDQSKPGVPPGTIPADEEDLGMIAAQEAAAAAAAGATEGGIGADGVGGPGAGGMGSPGGIGGGGSGAPGGESDQGPGSWRKGGWVRNDMDGKLEPVRGILHEGEFPLSPEMTALMEKRAPGLLNKIAKAQRRMVGRYPVRK